jgi:hypothetical protein
MPALNQIFTRRYLIFLLVCFITTPIFAQDSSGISDYAMKQIADILTLKGTFTGSEKKMSSNLIFANREARGMDIGPMNGLISTQKMNGGMVEVEIRANVSDPLLEQITDQGGQVKSHSADGIRARIPLHVLHLIAADPSVQSIREPSLLQRNAATLLFSQGYLSHRVALIGNTNINGSGVKVGVLSDSAAVLGSVPALMTSGELGPNTTILSDSPDGGSDEGAAMMEVIQDLAPKAQLFFATVNSGEQAFGTNITALANAGCSIIVDDTAYFDEPVFQDGVVAQAINAFVANGGLYITAAGNNGDLDSGTSGTWEGDFLDGGPVGPPLSGTVGISKTNSVLHNFGTAQNPKLFDTVTAVGADLTLQWAEPQGGATSDYDLFILDSTGSKVVGSSSNVQPTASNPFEEISAVLFAVSNRVVITRASGSTCALHLTFFGGQLATATAGGITGHPGNGNAISVAATHWNSARTGVHPFNGVSNHVETFSSDGPRRIFFHPDGSPITPGNLLFSTSGGTSIQKPDVTAADGVVTHELAPYLGTSASAAHVAGIAALIKSANPSLTAAQIRQILTATALDSMAPGFDRDTGYGIVNAQAAVQAALATH